MPALPVLLVVGLMLVPLVCFAEEAPESTAEHSEWQDLDSIGLAAWSPGDRNLWDTGRSIRFATVTARGYTTGVIGAAYTASDAIRSAEGTPVTDIGTFIFMGVGAGQKLVAWNEGRSFIGAGASVYLIETPTIEEGWVWVDQYGRELGPVHEEKFRFFPEITAQVQLSPRLVLEACATIGSGELPPGDGVYVGLAYRRW